MQEEQQIHDEQELEAEAVVVASLDMSNLREHSSITSSKRWVGSEMAIFDDLQYWKSSKRWVGGPKKVKNMMT